MITNRNEIREKFEEKYPEYRVSFSEVRKHNGAVLTGVVVRKGEESVSPCIYLESLRSENIDETVEEIHKIVVNNPDAPVNIDRVIDLFHHFEQVRSRIFPKILRADWNRELLETSPHRFFAQDLVVLYRVNLTDNIIGKNQIASVSLTNEHMNALGVTEEDLYEAAMENIRGTTTFMSLFHMMLDMREMLDMDGDELEDAEISSGESMYMLSNTERWLGSYAMLDPDILQAARNTIREDFWIIPSSVHELIAVPKSQADPEVLCQMIGDVNENMVDVMERLSDHVYLYENGEVKSPALEPETAGLSS